jgi:hypothetical protein
MFPLDDCLLYTNANYVFMHWTAAEEVVWERVFPHSLTIWRQSCHFLVNQAGSRKSLTSLRLSGCLLRLSGCLLARHRTNTEESIVV